METTPAAWTNLPPAMGYPLVNSMIIMDIFPIEIVISIVFFYGLTIEQHSKSLYHSLIMVGL